MWCTAFARMNNARSPLQGKRQLVPIRANFRIDFGASSGPPRRVLRRSDASGVSRASSASWIDAIDTEDEFADRAWPASSSASHSTTRRTVLRAAGEDAWSAGADVTCGKRLVVVVGQHRALVIAVDGAQTRRRRSKLRVWPGGACPVNPSLQPTGAAGR